MRPSKFLLPDSTEQTTSSHSAIAFETASGSGPEFPMHVVQPYPTRWNRSFSSGLMSPACSRYSVTTFDPGAKLVLTHGLVFRPSSTAFLAINPAAIITDGLEVLVQLVIAAITTDPCVNTCSMSSMRMLECDGRGGASPACPPSPSHRPTGAAPAETAATTAGGVVGFIRDGSASANFRGTSRNPTRSCGRRGPAMLGSTVARFSSSVSVYVGSGASGM